ncbi:phage tail assembly chaperone [Yersinia kristensenii]|uniref:phage tail assembly chaperone n=1 Tax=Yersinia kristensenii TaxID=28152 RepID=UPI0001A5427B|nr:hypothetical protein [Yersinia kristensenii]EEP89184.1 hypothetical protein ykris0001_2440 [Yersinia kristensenii ATCC 33638]PEH52750.1 hypothetical protein CRM81_04940 [Yersinia kristensenii]SUP70604.1 Uncharacterised protein [Yersinia kristensenii]
MEIEIKGIKYRMAKLNVFDQLKVSRKLLPILAGVVSDFRQLKASIDAKDTDAALEMALPKIADAVASLSDEDTNAIIFPCLKVVSREHANSWVPVMTQDVMAFDDIDLLTMLSLVARVVADSLGNFLQELPTSETPPL